MKPVAQPKSQCLSQCRHPSTERHSSMRIAIVPWVVFCWLPILAQPESLQPFFASTAFAQQSELLIQADELYRMDGSPPAPGSVLVRNGSIESVDSELQIDEGIPRLRVPVLMPGLVDAYARIAIEGSDAEQALEVAPHFDVLPGIDFFSRDFKEAADEGITTLHVLPGTDSVFAGQSVFIDSFSPQDRAKVWKPDGLQVIALCRDPTRGNRARSRPESIYVRQPTNRMGVVWIIRQKLQSLRATDSEEDPLSMVLDGKTPLLCVSRTEVDITSVLTLAADFGFSPVILDANEAYRVIDSLAGTNIPVVVREIPTQAQGRSLVGREETELRWNHLGRLHQAGIRFAIGGGHLLAKARFAVRFGLPTELALQSVTSQPAKILNIDAQVGSVEVGKRANLIALSGNPLSLSSRIMYRWIDGVSLDSPPVESTPVKSILEEETVDDGDATSVPE